MAHSPENLRPWLASHPHVYASAHTENSEISVVVEDRLIEDKLRILQLEDMRLALPLTAVHRD